jgi:putative metalloprotease
MDKQKQLQEFDPISTTVAAAYILIPLAINLAALFTAISYYTKNLKTDPKLSKKLNTILKDGKKWEVKIVPDKSPNAFAMIKPYVFITSGLLKMMDEDEIMAILLHEAGHINNMDVWRDLAAENTFMTIIFGAAVFLGGSVVVYALLTFMYFVGKDALRVLINRIMGRAAERRADNYAVKYGYGDALVSALNKMEELLRKMKAKNECGIICKLSEKISDMLDEHPPYKKRVEQILKTKETWEKVKNATFVNMRNFFQKAFGIVQK